MSPPACSRLVLGHCRKVWPFCNLALGAAIFVSSAALLLSGCAGLTTGANPSKPPANLSTLSTNPSSLSFGSVPVGSSTSQTITLNAAGAAGVNITQATSSNNSYSLLGATLPLNIAAGQSATIQVQFSPQTTGTIGATLSIVSNASNSPTTISLTGTGTAPSYQLTPNPASISFGDVVAGSNASQDVRLTNTGNSDVTISQVTVSGSGYATTGVTGGEILAPGQSVTLTVIFAPTATGSFAGSIAVASNAANSPLLISLSGGSHSVSLSWVASTSAIAGYYVYRGNASGGPYVKMNSSPIGATTFTDTAVASGQTYYYVVTAVDSNGVESIHSNEASATIPVP